MWASDGKRSNVLVGLVATMFAEPGVKQDFYQVRSRFTLSFSVEVEAIERAIGGKVAYLELMSGRPDLPLCRFRFEQLRQDRDGSLEDR